MSKKFTLPRTIFIIGLCLALFTFMGIFSLNSHIKVTLPKAKPDSTSTNPSDTVKADTIISVKKLAQEDKEINTGYIFDHILEEVIRREYYTLPLGECIGKVGQMLIGTKYVGGTLEEIPEKCIVDLNGVDCVTFFENSLDISRAVKIKQDEIKKNPYVVSFRDVLEQIEYTRYRDGFLDGYLSRLHYTSDWIADNVKKGVIKDITKDLGGKPFPVNVFFMSNNPQFYPQLASELSLARKVKGIEDEINAQKHWYIPNAQVKDIESELQTGDIIAIATNKPGLDYSHTGMIIKNAKGMALFLHASSAKKRVYLDKRISTYLASSSSSIGISVLRPIDPTLHIDTQD